MGSQAPLHWCYSEYDTITPEFLQACTHKLRFLSAATNPFLSLLIPLASLKRLGNKQYNLMQPEASVTYEANTRTVSDKKADDLTCFRSYSDLPSRPSSPTHVFCQLEGLMGAMLWQGIFTDCKNAFGF